tara:strand:+ start:5298 stop:6167 length:870 start_codon:yes stop_codon:yes gene_type:complete
MAYSINKKNGTISVIEGDLNVETSLELVGKDYFGYGSAIAQNFVKLLENFASDTAPSKPIEGQVWFDTANSFLSVWTGGDYPTGSWSSIDLGSTGPTTIKDTSNVDHQVWVTYQNGNAVAAFSSETAFTVHASDNLIASFSEIKTGITLATGTKMHGTATEAEYADLAELYSSDKEYEAGTVVKIGGEAEVTETTYIRDEDVFGVVSSDPAYLMNSMLKGTSVPVALAGRVPCKVTGEITKGQRLTSSDTPGVAIGASSDATHRQVIGRALESKTTEETGLIEIIVGVK